MTTPDTRSATYQALLAGDAMREALKDYQRAVEALWKDRDELLVALKVARSYLNGQASPLVLNRIDGVIASSEGRAR